MQAGIQNVLNSSGSYAPHGNQISLLQKYELWFDRLTMNGTIKIPLKYRSP